MYQILLWCTRQTPSLFYILIAISLLIWFLVLSFSEKGSFGLFESLQPEDTPWRPDASIRKAIVLASYTGQNVSWTKDIPADWDVFRYFNDDRSATYRTPSRAGNEANAYLTFIIDHYDNLPDFTVFLHGHDRGWHQPEHSVRKIRALNLSALNEVGYINMRCSHIPGCSPRTIIHLNDSKLNPNDHRWMLDVLPGFVASMFPELKQLPDILGSQCCAQFAASKRQIRRRSKIWWIKYRQPLQEDIFQWSINQWQAPSPGIGGYKAGILYEKTSHMAFGKETVHCPDENYCRRVYFSDAIRCDKYTTTFRQSKQSWRNITCFDN